jgi:uncharacterized SAM-binding protein YcdF (DUF218 family)
MRTAIIVPGQGAHGPDGAYRISSTCLGLVREAERIAQVKQVEAVVFTGWAPRAGLSEAEQMRSAWNGPDVQLLIEPTARITAENAARTVPLLVAGGIRRAVVVCAPFHLYRTRFFFSRLYGMRGIETEFLVADVARSVRALLWELLAAAACKQNLRAAEAELLRELGP